MKHKKLTLKRKLRGGTVTTRTGAKTKPITPTQTIQRRKTIKKTAKKTQTAQDKQKLTQFGHLFFTYINQIFGDRTVRTILYETFGNKKYNKYLRFGLVAFNRHTDRELEWVESNEPNSVPKSKASYYDNKVDQVTMEDSEDNHHVLYDIKNAKYIDSVNTQGMLYQNQKRDVNDALCQSYTLMFFLNQDFLHIEFSNDPILKQMQIIDMYYWLLNQTAFLNKINDELFFEKDPDQEHWFDEFGNVLPTQNSSDFNYIISRIQETLELWRSYGYWYFIGKGNKFNVSYNMDKYQLYL